MNLKNLFKRKEKEVAEIIIENLSNLYFFDEYDSNTKKIQKSLDILISENITGYVRAHLIWGVKKIGDQKEYYRLARYIIDLKDPHLNIIKKLSNIQIPDNLSLKYYSKLDKFLNSYHHLFREAENIKRDIELLEENRNYEA